MDLALKRARGIIALTLAILIGLVAAKAVRYQLDKPAPVATSPAPASEAAPPPPVTKIPAGMREVSIRVDEVSGVSRQLRPGDVVDILAVASLDRGNKGSRARIVLRGVTVHRVDGDDNLIVKNLMAAKKNWTVSLILPPDQAALLTAADKEADLVLMAYGRGDAPEAPTAESPDGHASYAFSPEHGPEMIPAHQARTTTAIPEGMRVFSLNLTDEAGFCSELVKGDRVDVVLFSPYALFDNDSGDISAGTTAKATDFKQQVTMLLQNVSVFDIAALKNSGTGGQYQVRLAVGVQDAMKLAAAAKAANKSKLLLLPRNGNDQTVARVADVSYMDLILKRTESRRIPLIKGTHRQLIQYHRLKE